MLETINYNRKSYTIHMYILSANQMCASPLSQKTCVAKLIFQLEKMLAEKNALIQVIDRPKTLLAALKELDTIVEMDTLKEDIVEQILSFCINKYRNIAMRKRILHFCNYGNPGTGKTHASKIIAKIYYALGCVNYIQERKEEKEDIHKSKLRFLNAKLKIMCQDLDILRKNYSVLKERHHVKKINKSTSSSLISRSLTVRSSSNEDPWKTIDQTLELTEEAVATCRDITQQSDGNDTSSTHMEDDNPNIEENVYCIVCGRNELVAKFMGQTAGQTYNFLMANRGKTIIIEEAYVLWTGERDIMGFEALVEIHRFMDEHSNEAIIGFNGYEKLLTETIFKIQPGLQGRINNFYHMKGYTPHGLANIFIKQLESIGIVLQEMDLFSFFEQNSIYFPSYGRDTLRLVRQLETSHTAATFSMFCENVSSVQGEHFILNKNTFDAAVSKYIQSSIDKPIMRTKDTSSDRKSISGSKDKSHSDY